MTARPRLLFLSQCLPFPPHSGVTTRTLNILRQLQVAYDVDVVAFSRTTHQPDRASRASAHAAIAREVSSVAEPVTIPGERSEIRRAWDHLRSVVSGRAYTWYVYDSRAFGDQLRNTIRRRPPDLVHVDSLDLHRWLPELPAVPVACTHHDIDSELLGRRARHAASLAARRYLTLQANRLEHIERTVCPRLALNVMVSSRDALRLRAMAPGARTVIVPNGTDTEYFKPSGTPEVPGQVAFVGPTYAHPNRDAVEFLLREIWPRVRDWDQTVTLRLIGGSAPDDMARYAAQPGVTALGDVPDIRPPLHETACCVVPIRIGGGTRLKILDAWAMGKAVVSTSVGCEGLDAVDGENILIRNTPEEIADAVVRVVHDPGLRAHLERNARNTATSTYTWAAAGKRIRAAYHELLGEPVLAAD